MNENYVEPLSNDKILKWFFHRILLNSIRIEKINETREAINSLGKITILF